MSERSAAEIERLVRLADRGDAEAAEVLWGHARRLRDPAAAVTAARVLDDAPRLARACAWAWREGDVAAADRAARGLGFVLEAQAGQALLERLDAVNAASHLPLTLEHVWLTLSDAVSTARGVAYHHGGEGHTGQRAALCLAVRSEAEGTVTVGLAAAPAWRCSPGRAWPELQPWRHDRITAESEVLRHWAAPPQGGEGADADVRVRFALARPRRRDPEPSCEGPLAARLEAMLERPELVAWEAIEQLFAEWPEGAERRDGLWRLREVAFAHPELERRASVAWYEARLRGKARAPLLEVLALRNRRLGDVDASELVSAPWLAQFTRLDLSDNLLGDAFAHVLAGSPHVGHLRALDLAFNTLGRDGLLAILASPSLPALRRLSLTHASHPLATPVSLEPYALPNVELLFLSGLALGDRGVEGLVEAPALRSVQSLSLVDNGLTPRSVAALVDSPWVGALQWLDLSTNPVLGDEALGHLADAPRLAALERLILRGCGLGPRGLRALALSPLAERLHEIVLTDNLRLGDGLEGVLALTAGRWPRLVRLSLAGCRIGAPALAALLEAGERVPALRDLDLRDNRLDDAAAALLAEWPGLARLRRLELSRVRVGASFVERLAASPWLRPGVVRGLPELDDTLAPVRVRYTV